jgi:plastocyanin
MTGARVAAALAGALLLLAAGGLAGTASAGESTTAIGVRNGISEFSFSLSRNKVKPGPAIIQYTNTGEDPHDVMIRRRGAERVLAIGETLPGGVNTLPATRLRRDSRYVFWCSLEGHREAGMEAVLRVKRRG